MKIFVASCLSLVTCLALGQTGPGGVGNSTTNVLWLSADNEVYSNTAGTTPAGNGDNVAVWADRSGNGHNAIHGTAGERPNYETGVVNSKPAIRFTAANGDRLLATLTSGTGGSATVWAVASWVTLPSSNPGIIQAAPAGLPFSSNAGDKTIGMWVANGSGNQVWGRGVQSNGTSLDIPRVTSTSSNTFYSFMNRYGGSTIVQYANNATAGSVGYNGTLRSWSEFGIGRQGNETWNGYIAEVIAFNTAVNDAQRIIIANYLSAKYNLALPSSNFYTQDDPGQGNFDHEVAGIGRVNASNQHTDAQGSGILRILNPSGLGDNEFLIWGHDNGALQATVTTGLPAGVTARFERQWRASEIGDVGAIDLQFDLSGLPEFAGMDECTIAFALRLLVDTNNDNNYANQTPIGGATYIGNNVYRFANVTALGNNMRFTLAVATPTNTGPAGVGATDGSSSLKLWLRSDSGIISSGGVVDSWTNSAGISDLDLSETGSQRPALVAAAVNGFPEVSFDGSNRLRTGFTLTTSNFVTNEAATFVVTRADNTTQMSNVYMTDPLGSNRFSNHIPWTGSVVFDIGDCCGADARIDVPGLSGLDGYSVWSYNASPSTGKQLYRNGEQLQSRANTSTYTGHASERFNIGGNSGAIAGFEGDITEVIIYNAKVNAAQRILIENYLAAKYGLTLSQNDIYTRDNPGQGNFDYDVAGIGRVDASNIHDDARGTGIVRIFNPGNLQDNEFLIWGHDNGSINWVNTVDVPDGVQGRLPRVWRVSEVGNVGSVSMQFDLTAFEPITASDLRLLIDDDGDGDFAEESTIVISGATSLTCGTYLFSGVSGGSITDGVRFTIGTANIIQTPLPIELRSFAGTLVDGDAHLRWTTATETNNHFFTVERSHDGKHFSTVGEVPGSGTTREPRSYTHVDYSPPYGVSYYRLKQTDFDGAYSYSDVIRIENRNTGTQLIAAPNPVWEEETLTLRIRHHEMIDMRDVHVRIVDIVGREVPFTTVEADSGWLTIRLAQQQPGICLVTAFSPQLRSPLTTRVLKK